MKSPYLSIVIATYNSAKTLEKCLESIKSQTFKDVEVIIIDGLSTDGTIKIINRYKSLISYWKSEKDDGIYDAWNKGVKESSGEYICFVGSDDYLTNQDSLEILRSRIGDQKYDLVLFQGIFLKSDSKKEYIVGSDWNQNQLIKMPICHPGMLHHWSLFDRIGKFNTEFKIAGDYDFMLRLSAETKTLYIDTPLITIMDGGISRSQYLRAMAEKRIIRSRDPRIGKFMATFHYYNKLWRIPIAKFLNIPY